MNNATPDHGYANSNYAPLRKNTPFARSVLDEELSYRDRASSYARTCSEARLNAWARRFPWIRKYLERKIEKCPTLSQFKNA